MDSFGTYIDHLILLLAARFQAPLEVSTDELLSVAAGDPWELVARSVQVSLGGPLTPHERVHVRQLDPHHFTAAVCRERARYVQWKLSEEQRRSRADHRAARAASAGAATTATSSAVVETESHTFDVTRDSLQRDVSALYALVRQSLPSTLDSDSESDAEEEEMRSAPTSAAAAAATATPPLAAQLHNVFVRTAEERHKDEQVARARDEFLSQVQALQTVYYNKYHRWMEAPADILEPPPTATASSSSRRSSQGATAGLSSGSGARQLVQHNDEDERAALLAALRSAGAGRSAAPTTAARAQQPPAPAPNVRTGAHPTIAAMRRQVHLQRPLRPSAVATDDAVHAPIATAPPPQQQWHRETGAGVASSLKVTSNAPAAAAAAETSAAARRAADVRPSAAAAVISSTVPVSAAVKETAPPVSRRGRWQIVEYGDDGEEDEEEN